MSYNCDSIRRSKELVHEIRSLLDFKCDKPTVVAGAFRTVIPFVGNYDNVTNNRIIAEFTHRNQEAQQKLVEAENIYCGIITKLRDDNSKLRKDLSQFQRSIIIIGRTGSGKSALANVLLNKNGNFEEAFEEHDAAISGTKDVQVEEFTAENKIKYRIIDFIGFGDTKLSSKEVINKIKESVCKGDYNLNQVLFVFNGKLKKEDRDAFNDSTDILSNNIFDENITKFITIVRTGFPGFRNTEKCKKDFENVIKENKANAEMLKSCDNKYIHVDNPPLNDNFSENEIADNKNRREASRKILLDHLLSKCQESYQGQEDSDSNSYLQQEELYPSCQEFDLEFFLKNLK